ncbi:MAG TPA: hypothetical protein VIK61_16305 [Acidimicrobiia bacterium]
MAKVPATMAVKEARDTRFASTSPTDPESFGVVRLTLVITLSCALGYAVVATPLALVNHFERGTVLLAASGCAAVFAFLWLRATGPLGRFRLQAPTIVALSTIAGMTAINMRFASQNVVQDRDPGAYIDSGQWFAHHHTFFFDGLVGAFARHPHQLFVAGAGFVSGAPGGRLYPQFLHVVPAFLAGANWIGGSAMMYRANAALGALALLAFFAFARTWLHERLATVAVVLLTINLVEVLHSRNTYSEILSQVFLFGGLWALTEADRVRRLSVFAIAGLMLGATCMVRIDAFLFLIPLTVVATVRLWRAHSMPRDDAVRMHREVAVASLGVLCTSALGAIDGVYFSRPYIASNKGFLLEIGAAWIATIVGCNIALRVHARRERPLLNPRLIRTLGAIAALAIVLVFAWAWFVRPSTTTGYQIARPAGGIYDLRTAQLPAKRKLRTYSEHTVPRLNLFVGAATLAGGILGTALITRRVLSDPSDPRLAFLLLFGLTTALYVWQPSIAPDMVWFLRRFLPVTIPGLILFSMVLTQDLVNTRWPIAKVGAAVLIVGGLVVPVSMLPHYVFQRTHESLAAGVNQTCAHLGSDAAIVIVQSSVFANGPQYRYPQALQAFCRVPVATAPPGLGSQFYQALAVEWQRQGRRLEVVANLPQALAQVPGTARVLQQSKYRVLDRTLHHRPTRYVSQKLILFFKPVPVSGT